MEVSFMRRHLSLALSLVLIAAAGAAAGVATAGASTRTPLAVPHTSVRIVSGTACKPVALFCFKPTAKKIAVGTKVIFKNTTLVQHTVTRCDALHCVGADGGTGTDSGFGSGLIASGGKYSFVFHGAGTYVFYCMIHGYALMHGTITVT
jgi:Plastocyanin